MALATTQATARDSVGEKVIREESCDGDNAVSILVTWEEELPACSPGPAGEVDMRARAVLRRGEENAFYASQRAR
jgi:hypothetical protein